MTIKAQSRRTGASHAQTPAKSNSHNNNGNMTSSEHRRTDHDRIRNRHGSGSGDSSFGSDPGSGSNASRVPFLLLLSAACLLTYCNALWADFVFDDISAIKENK